MNILVPTDFSEFADAALEYAIGFARDAKATVTILHVANMQGLPKARVSSGMLKKYVDQSDIADMNDLMNEIDAGDVEVKYHVVESGAVTEAIVSYAKGHSVNLIIMGSKGASGLRKLVMGTNAIAVINESPVPVIIVPERLLYTNIGCIVYATDLKNLHEELEAVALLAKSFNASIKIVHIADGDVPETARRITLEQAISETGLNNVECEIIWSKDPLTVIERYTQENGADLLALFTHKTIYWSHFFDRSTTRELAFHNRLPLYVINNR